MSALLKIIQGPNAGAEIALPDGVEITVGKADTCDIVLADPTLPDAPLKLSADASGGVTLDGAPLEPFHVHLFGSTALAVGPADAAWSPLVWPKPEKDEEEPSPSPEPPPSTPAPAPANPKNPKDPKNPGTPQKRSRLLRFILSLLALLLLLLLLLGLLVTCSRARSPQSPPSQESQESQKSRALAAVADRYHLTLDASSSRPSLSGNFATRADRLAATAELYSSFPGVALDLTDDESLRAAVADSLFTLGQSSLAVAAVSNRVASLSGLADSPADLSAAIDALRADVPRLAEIDTAAVNFRSPVALASAASPAPAGTGTAASRRRAARAASTNAPTLPVCGILTTPYPCLVLQNGTRVFPGAPLGGSVVVSIAADSVVLTNANGSFTWKP